MLQAVCCARKLTKNFGFFKPVDKNFRKGWLNTSDFFNNAPRDWGVLYPCSIYSFDLSSFNQNIDSIVMSYVKIGQNQKIEIFVNEVNNFCWQRFYICKEIIHIVASNKSNSTLGFNRINEVIEKMQSDNFLSKDVDEAYQIERSAVLGAMELLLPKELVEKEDRFIGNDYTRYTDSDIERIAEKYKVPKLIVKERFMSLSLRQLFADCYNEYKYVNADFAPVMG